MKEDDLPKTSLRENNILEATFAYDFPDALLTFTFAYGSRSQYFNVPLLLEMKGVDNLEDRKPPNMGYH